MVNTAGAARWCGQAIEDRSRVRSGYLGVLMQARPDQRGLEIRGQKNGDGPSASRIRHALLRISRIVWRKSASGNAGAALGERTVTAGKPDARFFPINRDQSCSALGDSRRKPQTRSLRIRL